MVFRQEIKIPKERIAVLIGTKGSIKKKLEKRTKTKIIIDSKEGDVTIEGEDSLAVYDLQNVIKAIGRGFNPETATLLFDENYAFELIEIKNFTGKSQKKFQRIKSRIIGTKGKARSSIEILTNTYISIYGKTVGIIGKIEEVTIAREAIELVLSGAPHGHVYNMLERKKQELRKKHLEKHEFS